MNAKTGSERPPRVEIAPPLHEHERWPQLFFGGHVRLVRDNKADLLPSRSETPSGAGGAQRLSAANARSNLGGALSAEASIGRQSLATEPAGLSSILKGEGSLSARRIPLPNLTTHKVELIAHEVAGNQLPRALRVSERTKPSAVDADPSEQTTKESEVVEPVGRSSAGMERRPTLETPSAAMRKAFRTARMQLDFEVRKGERQDFWLSNGEKISAFVLNDSGEHYLLRHPVLGEIMLSKDFVAKRLVEVFLRNGDRLVGELVHEGEQALSIQHTCLGLVTVPREEVCSKVGSYKLENGDRVVGEVVEETDDHIQLRGGGMGDITVPRSAIKVVLQQTF